MDGTVPEKEFLVRRDWKNFIPLRTAARECAKIEESSNPRVDLQIGMLVLREHCTHVEINYEDLPLPELILTEGGMEFLILIGFGNYIQLKCGENHETLSINFLKIEICDIPSRPFCII